MNKETRNKAIIGICALAVILTMIVVPIAVYMNMFGEMDSDTGGIIGGTIAVIVIIVILVCVLTRRNKKKLQYNRLEVADRVALYQVLRSGGTAKIYGMVYSVEPVGTAPQSTCPSCGYTIVLGAKICPNCGYHF
ncbi:MAG TPA: zinc-ribbon domain-containing protein [Candidatus Lokiarchaeia archaeon]|nr:zinc-ribbon domain-containing protein [Candidatus Lokiarchaeia archaeon]